MADQFRLYGWVTPKGRYIETRCWYHLEDLANEPEVCDVDELKALLAGVRITHDICESQGYEYHRYHMAVEDIPSDTAHILYEHGYIRIGTTYDGVVCFEGAPEALKQHYSRLKALVPDDVPWKMEPLQQTA